MSSDRNGADEESAAVVEPGEGVFDNPDEQATRNAYLQVFS
jgi:hypothetical protein